MKKTLIFTLVMLLFNNIINSQVIKTRDDGENTHKKLESSAVDTIKEVWVRNYNHQLGNIADNAYAMAIDRNGNLYVTGSSGDQYSDYITIKYKPTGEEEWTARYNGPSGSTDIATAITVDTKGNIYVTGKSNGLTTGCDYATIKYNSSGGVEWIARYTGAAGASDIPVAIATDTLGNVFVTGNSSANKTDFVTIKYSSTGKEKWVARYNAGTSLDYARALAVDKEGNAYVTGASTNSNGNFDFVTIKYDLIGAEKWIARYNGPEHGDDKANAITIDTEGNVLVTGQSQGNNSQSDYATIMYSPTGILKWVARYNGPGNNEDVAYKIGIDNEGNIIITGESGGDNTSSDYATIKYSPTGEEKWIARYNGPGNSNDYPSSMTLDEAGNIFLTGASRGSGTEFDYATIKYSSSGEEKWVARYNGPGNNYDQATSLVTDNAGNVFVTGHSYGLGTNNYDYTTIMYNSSGEEKWVTPYNGSEEYNDYANAIAADSAGNVYITGDSKSDYATIKYSPSGEEEWSVRYSGFGKGSNYGSAIAVDRESNVIVTGKSDSDSTKSDCVTIKYSPTGEEKWVARYNGPGNDWDDAKAIITDDGGNIYITGASIGLGTDYDYATIKYSPTGEEKWIARYNGPGNLSDMARAIAIDKNGYIYVTGQSYSANTNNDFVTIKYNSTGEEKWVARYNGPGNLSDAASAMVVDDTGNVYVTGYSYASANNIDCLTIKYNSSGEEKWIKRYNGPGDGYDFANAIAQDTEGNIYISGYSKGVDTKFDYVTIKYNSAGEEKWIARYNGPGNDDDRADAIIIDKANNIIVTGESHGAGTEYDYTTIGYSSSGEERWIARYNGAENKDDYPCAIALDAVGNIFVTGTATTGDGARKFTTIKYEKSPVFVENEDITSPHTIMLTQNYPNPFNPMTIIKYAVPKESMVKLIVYDIMGKEVRTLVNGNTNTGYKEIVWDGKDNNKQQVSSGVYIYQLLATSLGDGKVFTKSAKMVMMK